MSSETDRACRFDFGQAKLEMSIRHPRGGFTLLAGYTTLGFGGIWARDSHANIKKCSMKSNRMGDLIINS